MIEMLSKEPPNPQAHTALYVPRIWLSVLEWAAKGPPSPSARPTLESPANIVIRVYCSHMSSQRYHVQATRQSLEAYQENAPAINCGQMMAQAFPRFFAADLYKKMASFGFRKMLVDRFRNPAIPCGGFQTVERHEFSSSDSSEFFESSVFRCWDTGLVPLYLEKSTLDDISDLHQAEADPGHASRPIDFTTLIKNTMDKRVIYSGNHFGWRPHSITDGLCIGTPELWLTVGLLPRQSVVITSVMNNMRNIGGQ